MVWKIFFQIFFCEHQRGPLPKIPAKFSDLLFFVVATKKIYRFFLYHHVDAHLKSFLAARTRTRPNLVSKIEKNALLLNFFGQIRLGSSARGREIFQMRINMMIKKKICQFFFVATTKNNKSENLARILGRGPRWCSQKHFEKECFLNHF